MRFRGACGPNSIKGGLQVSSCGNGVVNTLKYEAPQSESKLSVGDVDGDGKLEALYGTTAMQVQGYNIEDGTKVAGFPKNAGLSSTYPESPYNYFPLLMDWYTVRNPLIASYSPVREWAVVGPGVAQEYALPWTNSSCETSISREEALLESFEVRTRARSELRDVTREVASSLEKLGASEGACVVFVPHTTAGVTINENADPSVRDDIVSTLDRMVPWNGPYRHSEGNSAAHVKAAMVGSSVTIPVRDGRLAFGTWQGIFFCEFDGPRTRHVHVLFLPATAR